jgi:hypothetical protein
VTEEHPPASTRPANADRRELGSLLLLTLVGGGGLVLTSGRAWFDVTVARQAPFGPLLVDISGRKLFPALNGLAIVAVLIAVLVLVTKGWARRLLGVLLLVVGCWSGWYAIRGVGKHYSSLAGLLGDQLSLSTGTPQVAYHPVWAYLSVLCAVLLVLAAVGLIARAGRWQFGLSAKYAAPVEVAKSDDPWRSLDRGEDPTILDR